MRGEIAGILGDCYMHRKIGVLGGSGFVGHYLVARLVKQGCTVRVLTRHRERHRDLLVLPTAELIEADVHDPAALERHLAGQDAVINLVGILNEKRDNGQGFHQAHVALAEKLIHACHTLGIQRVLHMSALHADAKNGVSYYLRSKGEAEDLVHAAQDLHVTSFCPSVMFGPGDSFFNRFARLLKITPLVLPLACASSRFAPVYVGDVADAFVQSLDNPDSYGQRYNLCGPTIYTLKELVHYTAVQLGLKRWIIALGQRPSWFMANVFEHMPLFKPITRDNFRSLQIDSVCDAPFPALFKIHPKHLEEIVPGYIGHRE